MLQEGDLCPNCGGTLERINLREAKCECCGSVIQVRYHTPFQIVEKPVPKPELTQEPTSEPAPSTPNQDDENSGIKYNLINSLNELIVYENDSMYVRKFGFFNNKKLKEEIKITHNDISNINLKKRDGTSKKSRLAFSIGFACYLFELPASDSNNELLEEIYRYLGGK